MWTLQTNCRLKLISKKWTNIQESNGKSTAPNTTRTIYSKAWNSSIQYSSWDHKIDIKESYGSMWNSIFWKKVQGQKYPGNERLQNQNYLVSESLHLEFKMDSNGHKHPQNNSNRRDEIGR